MFVDGHKSHMLFKLSEECAETDNFLYTLLPNSAHILQPADVSVFKPLKSELKLTVRNSQRDNPNAVVTRSNFAGLIDKTVNVAAKETTIRNGFRACGLFPWNPNAVDFTKSLVDVPASIANETHREHITVSRDICCLKATNYCCASRTAFGLPFVWQHYETLI